MLKLNLTQIQKEVDKILKFSTILFSSYSMIDIEPKQLAELFLLLNKKYTLQTFVIEYEETQEAVFGFNIVKNYSSTIKFASVNIKMRSYDKADFSDFMDNFQEKAIKTTPRQVAKKLNPPKTKILRLN